MVVDKIGAEAPKCYAVYANSQGPRRGQCPFYHSNLNQTSQIDHQRGAIIQLSCKVKFHFFTPVLIDDTPSTNHLVIISYGVHIHPPPPARRVPLHVKDRLINAVKAFGVGEATARKLVASPIYQSCLMAKQHCHKNTSVLQIKMLSII